MMAKEALVRYAWKLRLSTRFGLLLVLNFVFPPRCLLCGVVLASDGPNRSFCPVCLGQLQLDSGPVCRRCGTAFRSRAGADHLCGRCLQHPRAFQRARSLGPYAGLLRKAIQALKYDRDRLLVRPLGTLLARRGAGLLGGTDYDCIMPVPLHAARLRQRGFNQALALARRVGKLWQVPVEAETLIKARQTKPQTMLPLVERQRNVRSAFACTRRLHGAKVLLVDDVYTSGSTAHECARVLRRNGAGQVDVLTLARTLAVRPQ